jgi:hypothetical protein
LPFLAPIFAAVAGAVGAVSTFVAGLGVVGSALVKIGGSLLLSAASRALMPKPSGPQVSMQDRKVSVRSPAAPRDLVYGKIRKGGQIVYINSSGDANNLLDLIIVFAGHVVEKIGIVYFDDEIALNAEGVAQGRYVGGVTVAKRLGTADQSAFQIPGNTAWTSAHRVAGCAAIHLRLTYTADRFPNGIPNVSVDIEGKNDILDPRDGVRRFTDNAALCVADYMSLRDFSLGAQIGAADGIDSDSLIEAANICDEVVAVPGGGTQARYTCNGTVTLAETPQSVIEVMLAAMAGSCAWLGGAWRIRAGAYRIPTVTLTDNDVRAGGMSLETRVSRTQSANAVRGTFISPSNNSQVDDFPAYESAVYLAEDGGERRWLDMALPFTDSASMAQRLARIELERIRRQMTVNLSGKLSAWRVSVGGTVMLTYARWGLAAKPFEVQGLTLQLTGSEQPELVPDLVLRETSPLVYDFDASEAAVYAAAPRTTLPSPFDIPAPGGLVISESLYATRDGGGVKALVRLDWVPSASAFVSEYIVAMKPAGGEWIERGRTSDLRFEVFDVDPGIQGFRVKAVSGLGVSSPWFTIEQEVYGLGADPVAITGATLQAAGGLAIIKWDLHADLDVRIGGAIVIRHTTSEDATWAGSVSMERANGAQTNTALPLKPGTYILRAQDSGGRLGPSVSVATSGAQVVAFSSAGFLQADSAYSGTKDGTVAMDGVLRLAAALPIDDWGSIDGLGPVDTIGGIVPEGIYSFASGLDLGSVKVVRLRSDIELTAVDMFDLIDARENNIDEWPAFDGVDGGEVDVVMEVRVTPDDPAAEPVWSYWSRVDNTEISARGIQSRARLKSTDNSFTPAVTRLRLYADEVA